LSRDIKNVYDKVIVGNGLPQLKLFLESGRAIAGPYGFLVTKVRHIKNTYKLYAGLDASMQNLMRPALYGAYHHITVMGKENLTHNVMYDVTGSLCENNDKFAIDRMLPELEPGDIVVMHDTGAHGHSMGFNYNAKLRSAELLLRKNGDVKLIRRAETQEDYFATLDINGLDSFEV
jgi:diaminopimelate decarboxylase